ncbi:Sulfatase [Granulicella rosea]|uniref:Sulfatase n=1 Tax=Granulicella rosea TaxID=474952 RepID=A0A239DJ48_9BACT|nr:sulfatase-like hydrolase/transferase [Granulicella rosea]SNS31888.1 Sulfatase [Granulicella rosea]
MPSSTTNPLPGRIDRIKSRLLYRRLKKFSQCIGLSSLILVINYGELLGGGRDIRMHYPYGLGAICLAHIADILLLGLGFFLILAPLHRTPIYQWVRLVLAILIPPYLVTRIESALPFDIVDGLVPILSVVWAALLLLLMLRYRLWYRRTTRFASAIVAFLGFFAVSAIGQLLWVARWTPPSPAITATWALGAQPPRVHPVLVWILFDELSYEQVFERRAHDLQMPNFDKLRAQSTVFTDVQPAGYKTVKVIPSLFTGHQVDDFRFSGQNRFWLHFEDEKGWHPISGRDTVFGDAKRNGWRTAVVGWYNPYCTLYGDAIDQCYWSNKDKLDGPMIQGDSFRRNVESPLAQLGRDIQHPGRATRHVCTEDVQRRTLTHKDIDAHALQLLRTDQADFVFLHFAVPHSPNIWSRITDDYTQNCGSSYLDGLALADRELGRLMKVLQASPRWQDTTVIVQGDHSWRIELWEGQPSWTDEDDQASRDTFDPRPALLIHQPGQTQPKINGTAWPLQRLHEIALQIVRGQPVKF